MTKVLVIGANGFIGSHVVDELVSAGHEVTAFDRFSGGLVSFDHATVRVVAGDFLNSADLAAALEGQEEVLHFLSTTSPASTQFEPTLDVRTNVMQTITLLEMCAATDIDHIYFASSGGAIYGQQERQLFSENDQALPVSPYAIGKLTVERYLDYFRLTHGLRSTVFRISNPYGPRQHPHKVQGLIPIALRRVFDGLPVTRMGDGSMVRDYVYVTDVAHMISQFVGRTTQHHTYNLGSGTGHTVNDVLGAIRRYTSLNFAIDEVDKPSTFVDHVVLDTSRYTEEFGSQPLTSLEDGVRITGDAMLRERR